MSSNTNRKERSESWSENSHRDHSDEISAEVGFNVCEECGGRLFESESHGDLHCRDCGLVVEFDRIDHGPEWTGMSDSDESKSRVGSPVNNLLHDKGMTTRIDTKNRDGYGNRLSNSQRQRAQKLREKNKWAVADGAEQKLRYALNEIRRMSSSLGLPKSVQEVAAALFRRARSDGLLISRSIEHFSAACVYAASRKCNCPRTLDDINSVCRDVSNDGNKDYDLAVGRDYRYICNELGLKIEPNDPLDFLNRLTSELDVDFTPDVTELAKELVAKAQDENLHSGVKPISLMAACLYIASNSNGVTISQYDLAPVAGVSQGTIRKRYQDIVEVIDVDRCEVVAEGRFDN